MHVVARNIAEKMDTGKPIVFAVALKDTSPRTVRALASLVVQHKVW